MHDSVAAGSAAQIGQRARCVTGCPAHEAKGWHDQAFKCCTAPARSASPHLLHHHPRPAPPEEPPGALSRWHLLVVVGWVTAHSTKHSLREDRHALNTHRLPSLTARCMWVHNRSQMCLSDNQANMLHSHSLSSTTARTCAGQVAVDHHTTCPLRVVGGTQARLHGGSRHLCVCV